MKTFTLVMYFLSMAMAGVNVGIGIAAGVGGNIGASIFCFAAALICAGCGFFQLAAYDHLCNLEDL